MNSGECAPFVGMILPRVKTTNLKYLTLPVSEPILLPREYMLSAPLRLDHAEKIS